MLRQYFTAVCHPETLAYILTWQVDDPVLSPLPRNFEFWLLSKCRFWLIYLISFNCTHSFVEYICILYVPPELVLKMPFTWLDFILSKICFRVQRVLVLSFISTKSDLLHAAMRFCPDIFNDFIQNVYLYWLER